MTKEIFYQSLPVTQPENYILERMVHLDYRQSMIVEAILEKMEKYRELLSKISTNVNGQSEYNIFNVLGVEAKEVVMCRFLADLLNPEGAHGCGILFLKFFFQRVFGENKFSDTLLAHTDVVTEYVIDHDRRIDIAIYNALIFIPIEVKIYAGEQEGQCYDYYEFARKYDENVKLIYLTRFGNQPSEYSRKKKDGTEILSLEKIICISWDRDICGWLRESLGQLTEPVRGMIAQYIDAVLMIADRSDEETMEKNVKVLHESPDYFQAGIEIEKSMKAAKVKLIRLVFDDFKDEMEKFVSKYGLEFERETNYYSYEETRHEKYYDYDSSTYPGLNYIIKSAKFKKSSLQMWFRIEVEDNLFAGIALFDTEAEGEGGNGKGCNSCSGGNGKGYQVDEITDELMEEAAQFLDRDIMMPVDWWLAWCYSNGRHQAGDYQDVPNFKKMNRCAVELVDTGKRKEFVRQAAGTFEEKLLKYLIT